MSLVPSPAARTNLSVVMSALALLVALSGTAYAVANGSVGTAQLAKGAVTTPKLKDRAVTEDKLASRSVTNTKLGPGSVINNKIANNSVTTSKIADETITSRDLSQSSVGTEEVEQGGLRLRDLGGAVQPYESAKTSVAEQIDIAAGACQTVPLGQLDEFETLAEGSLVYGTINAAGSGSGVLTDTAAVLPTVLGPAQAGQLLPVTLVVCAGSSAQTIPAGSTVTWALIGP